MQKNKAVYVLHGDAKLLLEEKLNTLIKKYMPASNADFNYDMFDAETVDVTQVIAAANTLPVFADSRLVVVRRAEKYLDNKKDSSMYDEEEADEEDSTEQIQANDSHEGIDAVLKYAANPNPSCTLIFAASRKLDGRKKSFKELAKLTEVQNISEPQPRDTTNWVITRAKENFNKKISFDAAQYLIAAAGRNTSILASELEKLALYCSNKLEIAIDDIKEIAIQDSNLFVFDFIDALVEKKLQAALNILEDLMHKGEYPGKILVILASQLRALLNTKALKNRGLDKGEIAKAIGTKSDFVVQKYLRQEKHFSTEGLVKALTILSDTDIKTKLGMGEAKNLLLNAVINIAGLVK